MQAQLAAPFPWAGGKRKVVQEVWARFGVVGRYVEPFAGGAAMLLGRPGGAHGHELLGDLDGDVVNFWRSVQQHPEAVARAMDWPVLEADVAARAAWLRARRPKLPKLLADPRWCDPEAAGWWAWVTSNAMGLGRNDSAGSTRPTSGGRGVGGRRIRTAEDPLAELLEICQALSLRLRGVTVLHKDFRRVLTNGALWSHIKAPTPVAVFLDPPYDPKHITSKRSCYNEHDKAVSALARSKALELGKNPRLRVALCGYEGEHDMPPNWEVFAWSSSGFCFNEARRAKGLQERIWFSPACLKPWEVVPGDRPASAQGYLQLGLFGGGAA